MPNIDYAGPAPESAFRRMAMGAWAPPSDPTIYGFLDFDVSKATSRLDALRAQGVRVTWTHVVARAVAIALGRLPDMNVVPRLGRCWRRAKVDVFVQVAMPGKDGDLGGTDLSGVKILDADRKDLGTMASEMAERVDRVRRDEDPELRDSKKRVTTTPRLLMRPLLLLLHWLQVHLNLDMRRFGLPRDPFGSALVTSVGMLGVDTAFAPLFPIGGPPVVITVGSVQLRPVVDGDGNVVARPLLRLGGTFDHRAFDGFHIATFAREMRKVLEDEVDVL
jgi:pyruvate dehydrogenase E2 component (dihydrolipoamide acetyltransferase)